MNVITLEEEAFYELYYKLVAEIKQQLGAKPRNKWIDGNEAMAMLHIKSRTTPQKLRDEGKIRYSQPEPKIILYDADSIDAYLEKHAKETF
ncbi:MAG TPA: helix-turn-helix domain-containing protein [Flavipsychrobacter sp.]|nr:helix-turn-helix domain-containing protein [Flavipsychrobacter sp.]